MVDQMKQVLLSGCLGLSAVSGLDANSLFRFDQGVSGSDLIEHVVAGFGFDQNIVAEYAIESSPGADFISYGVASGISLPDMEESKLLELNTYKSSQKAVWGARSFHIHIRERNNGIERDRQCLRTADGLFVDYYPERPSAYIRKPGHAAYQFTLVDFLNSLPANLESLRHPVAPGGWQSMHTFVPALLATGSVEETEAGRSLSFFKTIEEFSSGAGYLYTLTFKDSDGMAQLSSIQIAVVGGATPEHYERQRSVWRTELTDYNAAGLPMSSLTRIWRYRTHSETGENKKYLVREIKCTLRSIGFADPEYDYSLHFDPGTFVTDEMTGSKYRVGNPLGALMEKVAE